MSFEQKMAATDKAKRELANWTVARAVDAYRELISGNIAGGAVLYRAFLEGHAVLGAIGALSSLSQRFANFEFISQAPDSPMTLNHLGKATDQIVRSAEEPAGLLVVQHCHDIGVDIRKTLRALAFSLAIPADSA